MRAGNDGGSAFPCTPPFYEASGLRHPDWPYPEAGMNLRDYFAAKAMQGGVANQPNGDALAMARYAYALADAMLIVRGQ